MTGAEEASAERKSAESNVILKTKAGEGGDCQPVPSNQKTSTDLQGELWITQLPRAETWKRLAQQQITARPLG